MNELDKWGPWLDFSGPGIPQSMLKRGMDELKDFASDSFADLVSERRAVVGAKSDLEFFCALDIEVMETEVGSLAYFVRNVESGVGFELLDAASRVGFDAMLSEVLACVKNFVASGSTTCL